MKARDTKELHERIDRGVRAGVARALREHKRLGQSIVVWRDGRVVEVPPEEIKVSDE